MLLRRGPARGRGQGGRLRPGPAAGTAAPRGRQVAGTPEYVAPERFLGAAYDHRADIYAFGVLAYETLTGNVPFRGPSYIATFTMHVEDPPPPMERARLAELPPQMSAAMMQMLEKDPAARPSSMAIVEAMFCEAQIAAGLHTAWDDLELPAVDERLAQASWPNGCRRPGADRRRPSLAGALALAAGWAAAAVYYGVFRAPEVVVKYVELTQTEEAEAVAALAREGQAAANDQRYTKPADETRR